MKKYLLIFGIISLIILGCDNEPKTEYLIKIDSVNKEGCEIIKLKHDPYFGFKDSLIVIMGSDKEYKYSLNDAQKEFNALLKVNPGLKYELINISTTIDNRVFYTVFFVKTRKLSDEN